MAKSPEGLKTENHVSEESFADFSPGAERNEKSESFPNLEFLNEKNFNEIAQDPQQAELMRGLLLVKKQELAALAKKKGYTMAGLSKLSERGGLDNVRSVQKSLNALEHFFASSAGSPMDESVLKFRYAEYLAFKTQLEEVMTDVGALKDAERSSARSSNTTTSSAEKKAAQAATSSETVNEETTSVSENGHATESAKNELEDSSVRREHIVQSLEEVRKSAPDGYTLAVLPSYKELHALGDEIERDLDGLEDPSEGHGGMYGVSSDRHLGLQEIDRKIKRFEELRKVVFDDMNAGEGQEKEPNSNDESHTSEAVNDTEDDKGEPVNADGEEGVEPDTTGEADGSGDVPAEPTIPEWEGRLEYRERWKSAKEAYGKALNDEENRSYWQQFRGIGRIPPDVEKEYLAARQEYANQIKEAIDKRASEREGKEGYTINTPERIKARFFKRYVENESKALVAAQHESLPLEKRNVLVRMLAKFPRLPQSKWTRYLGSALIGSGIAVGSGGLGAVIPFAARWGIGIVGGKLGGEAGHWAGNKIGSKRVEREVKNLETAHQTSKEKFDVSNLQGAEIGYRAAAQGVKKAEIRRDKYARVGGVAGGLIGGGVAGLGANASFEHFIGDSGGSGTDTPDGNTLSPEKPDRGGMIPDGPERADGASGAETAPGAADETTTPENEGNAAQEGILNADWYRVERGDTAWEIMLEKSEVLRGLSEVERNKVLVELFNEVDKNPEFAKAAGFSSGNADLILAPDPEHGIEGDVLKVNVLDEKLRELLGTDRPAGAAQVAASEQVPAPEGRPLTMSSEVARGSVVSSESVPFIYPERVYTERVGHLFDVQEGLGDERHQQQALDDLARLGLNRAQLDAIIEDLHEKAGGDIPMEMTVNEFLVDVVNSRGPIGETQVDLPNNPPIPEARPDISLAESTPEAPVPRVEDLTVQDKLVLQEGVIQGNADANKLLGKMGMDLPALQHEILTSPEIVWPEQFDDVQLWHLQALATGIANGDEAVNSILDRYDISPELAKQRWNEVMDTYDGPLTGEAMKRTIGDHMAATNPEYEREPEDESYEEPTPDQVPEPQPRGGVRSVSADSVVTGQEPTFGMNETTVLYRNEMIPQVEGAGGFFDRMFGGTNAGTFAKLERVPLAEIQTAFTPDGVNPEFLSKYQVTEDGVEAWGRWLDGKAGTLPPNENLRLTLGDYMNVVAERETGPQTV